MVIARALASAPVDRFLPPGDPALLPEARRPSVWEGPRTDEVLAWAGSLAAEAEPTLPFTAFRRFFDDGDRQEYEQKYFARRRRLQVFGLAVLSGRGPEFLGPLENTLWALCEESTWALPAHLTGPLDRTTVDLFAAETASALAELGGLLAGRLPPALAARMADEVHRRVLGPYLADREPWGWETADHNWAAVCGGAIGLAALWTLEAGPLARVLTRLGPTLDAYLSGFSADGLCLEGMGYWTYGFGYFTAFAELLLDRSRGLVNLWTLPDLAPRLAAVAGFPAAGRIGAKDFARFSDAGDAFRYPGGTCARLARRLGTPRGLDPALAEDLSSDRCSRWARQLRDLLWDEPAVGENPGPAPEVRWFPDGQWLVARGRWEGLEVGLAAKGGHNGEPHNHNDLGSFQLAAGGEVYVDDLGAGRYDRDYFGEGRYRAFVTRSAGHGVPLVDGVEQAPGADRRARAEFHHRPSPRLSLELSAAYPDAGLTALERTFVPTPETVVPLRVEDRWTFAGPGRPVTERLITQRPVRLGADRAWIEGPGAWVEVVCDPPVVPRLTAVVYPPHEGADRRAFCLDFPLEAGTASAVLTLSLVSPQGAPDEDPR